MPDEGRFRFGNLIRNHDKDSIIDQAVISFFAKPHSYTGEDVVEISTHGSPVVVAEILEILYSRGTRPAQPGEFTYRAFLNNRLDLTQAEAIADLISAKSREAADQAVAQLRGKIGHYAAHISEKVAQILMQCEVELDFVEDDIELTTKDEKYSQVGETISDIEILLQNYQSSRYLREGVKVAIVGAPNVGKSTLFNALVGHDNAIVHPDPGTTRDVLHASCMIDGVNFELFDTAGLRRSDNEVEDEGVRRAISIANTANLVIVVEAVDVVTVSYKTDREEKTVRVLNKVDLGVIDTEPGVISISAMIGINLDVLRKRLYELTIGEENPTEGVISRERHYRAVNRALSALDRARDCIRNDMPLEVVAEELRDSMHAIDELTGRRHMEGLIDEIFSNFCIGK